MKTSLTLFILVFCITCFAQSPVKKERPSVTPNAVQVEKLNAAYKELNDTQVKINDLTELIIGYKLDEVDSLRIENGQFKFVPKPKKK